MSKKPDKFFSPPSILIQVAIPNNKVDEALRQMRQGTRKSQLMGIIKERRPDLNFPKSTFFAILIKPNYKIKSAEHLVKASQDITAFQALFQTSIFVQNMPENIV